MENQPYQQPQQPTQGYAIAALVLGIVGIVGGFIPVVQYVVTLCSILAIVFGVMAKKRAALISAPTGMATAGLVLGIIALALDVVMIICTLAVIGAVGAAAGSGFTFS